MKTITLQTILDKMHEDAEGNRSCGFMILIFMAVIVALAGTAMLSVYGLIFWAMFGIPAFFLLRNSRKNKKNIKNRSFYIVSDTCRGKHTKSTGEDGDAYILTFSNKLEHTIGHGDVSLSTTETAQDDEWLYTQTREGDQFYMVYMDGAKRPTYIFPHKLCQLDTTGFILKDGQLRPNVS